MRWHCAQHRREVRYRHPAAGAVGHVEAAVDHFHALRKEKQSHQRRANTQLFTHYIIHGHGFMPSTDLRTGRHEKLALVELTF